MVNIIQRTKFVTVKKGISNLLSTFLFISFFMSTAAQAANITVTASRNPVALDDSFHLVYEADNSVDGEPDFSPIYQSFDVLSSSQSTNMRSINGNWSLKKSWDLTVIAKDVGKFTIAPVKFGKDISPAIQVTVTSSSSPDSTSPNGKSTVPAKIFLESSIDKKSGWVQSQFIYTVKLLRTVSIANASMNEPEISDADAIIKKVSEDSYQTTRNGIQYEVFERKYAIFPQKSGTLKIKPITFEGRINAVQPRSIFDQFRMSGQIKRLRSKAIQLNVKPAPASINLQDWLPATNVQLIDEWSDDIQNVKAGEPVTRTIMIAAEGLSGVQLPDLKLEEISGLKQYPDKAVIEDRQIGSGITGFKQFKVALIPASAGTYTLPEIKLQWWNTITGKKETATLPQTVLTATGTTAPAIAPLPVETAKQDYPVAAEIKTPAPATPMLSNEPYWKWLTLIFAVAWIMTLLAFFKKNRPYTGNIKHPAVKPAQSVKAAVSAVKKQAAANNAEATKLALIEWGKTVHNNKNINNLSDVSKYSTATLQDCIRQLNESLYSTNKKPWQGKDLLSAFKKELALTNRQNRDHASALKPLYNR